VKIEDHAVPLGKIEDLGELLGVIARPTVEVGNKLPMISGGLLAQCFGYI